MNLSRIHIVEVLGINVPLNESVSIPRDLQERILYEQELYESFLDTIKDFAGATYNKVVDRITDWKDAAVVFGKVLSSQKTLVNFTSNYWKNFKRTILPKLYKILEKIPLVKNLIPQIKKLIDKVTNMDGWKKFLVAVGIGSIINWGLGKIGDMAEDKVKEWIEKYVSEAAMNTISKFTDWKSYLGWLKPIIDGVEILYDTLKPTLNKFQSSFKLNINEIFILKKRFQKLAGIIK